MPRDSLRQALAAVPGSADVAIIGRDTRVRLNQARYADAGARMAGRTVVLSADGQLEAALAMIALDGVAHRMVVCPPDLSTDYRDVIAARVGSEGIVANAEIGTADAARAPDIVTEWVLLTSGTSGVPKTVRHTLATLTAAIKPRPPGDNDIIWGTYYDIRRYGGLQIFLRALLGGHSLVLSDAHEPMTEFLTRAGACGVTHLTGTPSHWRSALMSQTISAIAPRYVRLSGEIADQPVLDALRVAFPKARIVHAYASTEAGVGFEVTDEKAGFPAAFVEEPQVGFDMRVVDGALHIRSDRAALDYIGSGEAPLHDAEGFVDTGDMVERRGERYYFVGRRGGIINVGGAKVHPEQVEAVINSVPGVRLSQVKAKSNPIVGAIVVANVVAAGPFEPAALKEAILGTCRAELAEHKVPVIVTFVADLPLTPTGKLRRTNG